MTYYMADFMTFYDLLSSSFQDIFICFGTYGQTITTNRDIGANIEPTRPWRRVVMVAAVENTARIKGTEV
jgi:hypothetical protein